MKIKLIQILEFLLIVLYVGLLILGLTTEVVGDRFYLMLSVVLAALAFVMLGQGALIKSSSTLWFSLTLIMSAILLIFFDLKGIDASNVYYLFMFIPIISSLINLAIFENLIYIKVIILNISIIIPMCLVRYNSYDLWLTIVAYVVSISIGIVVCRFINLNREKDNG